MLCFTMSPGMATPITPGASILGEAFASATATTAPRESRIGPPLLPI